MTKTNYNLTEEDVTPFVLDAKGNELKIGDDVVTDGGATLKINKFIFGDIDQEPMLELVKITCRLASECEKYSK